MIKRLEKAAEIANQGLLYIDPILVDDSRKDSEFQFYVRSQNTSEKHMVTCVGNIWRCSCDDFYHNGLHNENGGFDCKHILAVKNLLISRLALFGNLESLKKGEC